MTFSRVNAGGWALYEVLTSAQMNALDLNVSRALDGNAGGNYTPSSDLKVHGKIIGESGGTRVFLYPLSAGVSELDYTSGNAMWLLTYGNASRPGWRAFATISVADRYIGFSLNRFVPQGCTVTQVRASVDPSATQATESNRMRMRLRDSNNLGDSLNTEDTAYYPNAGAHTQDWITSTGLSWVINSATRNYWVEIRSSLEATQDDYIYTLEISYTEGDYLAVP